MGNVVLDGYLKNLKLGMAVVLIGRLKSGFLAIILMSHPAAGLVSTAVIAGEDATRSLSIDAGVWATTYLMERLWYQPSGQRTFLSDPYDRKFRESVHNSDDTMVYNSTEEKWRKASDIGVLGLVGTSVVQPLLGPPERTAQVLAVSRAFAINNLLTTTLKLGVHRSRPKASRYEQHSQSGDDAKSFPSGHSSNAFVAATSLARMNPDSPLAFRAIGYTAAASIGIARVMADKHNLTDVVVGAVLGTAVTNMVFANFYCTEFQVTATTSNVTIHYSF